MKSVIYSNYTTKSKWKGIIEYKAMAIFIGIVFGIFSISNLLGLSFKVTCILLFTSFPIGSVLLFCSNNNESSIDIILNIFRFYLTSRIYCKDYKLVKNSRLKYNKIYIKKVVKNDFK